MKSFLIKIQQTIKNKLELLKNKEFRNKLTKNILVAAIVFIFFYILGLFIPEGFDWKMYFSQGKIHPIWTPWTLDTIHFINWPTLIAITGVA